MDIFGLENRLIFQQKPGKKRVANVEKKEVMPSKEKEFNPKEILDSYKELVKEGKAPEAQVELGKRIQEIADLQSLRWLDSLELIIKSKKLSAKEKKMMAEAYLQMHDLTKNNIDKFQKAALDTWHEVALKLASGEVIDNIKTEKAAENQERPLEEFEFLVSEAVVSLVEDVNVNISEVLDWKNFEKLKLNTIKSLTDAERDVLKKCQELGKMEPPAELKGTPVGDWMQEQWKDVMERAFGAYALLNMKEIKKKSAAKATKVAKVAKEKVPAALEEIGDKVVDFAERHPYITAALLFIGGRMIFGRKGSKVGGKLGALIEYGLKAAGVSAGIILAGHILKKLGILKWLKENFDIDLSVAGQLKKFKEKKDEVENKIKDSKQKGKDWLGRMTEDSKSKKEETIAQTKQDLKKEMQKQKEKLTPEAKKQLDKKAETAKKAAETMEQKTLEATKYNLEKLYLSYKSSIELLGCTHIYKEQLAEMRAFLDDFENNVRNHEIYKKNREAILNDPYPPKELTRVLKLIYEQHLKEVLSKAKKSGTLSDQQLKVLKKFFDSGMSTYDKPEEAPILMNRSLTDILRNLPSDIANEMKSLPWRVVPGALSMLKNAYKDDPETFAEIQKLIDKKRKGLSLTIGEHAKTYYYLLEAGFHIGFVAPYTYLINPYAKGSYLDVIGMFGYSEKDINKLREKVIDYFQRQGMSTEKAEEKLRASEEKVMKAALRTNIANIGLKVFGKLTEAAGKGGEILATGTEKLLQMKRLQEIKELTAASANEYKNLIKMGINKLKLANDPQKLLLIETLTAGKEPVKLEQTLNKYVENLKAKAAKRGVSANALHKELMTLSELRTTFDNNFLVNNINQTLNEASTKLQKGGKIDNLMKKLDKQIVSLETKVQLNDEFFNKKSYNNKIFDFSDTKKAWKMNKNIHASQKQFLDDARKMKNLLSSKPTAEKLSWSKYRNNMKDLVDKTGDLHNLYYGKGVKEVNEAIRDYSKMTKEGGKMIGQGFHTIFAGVALKELIVDRDFKEAVNTMVYTVPFAGPVRMILPDGFVEITWEEGYAPEIKVFEKGDLASMLGQYISNPLKRIEATLGVIALTGDTFALLRAATIGQGVKNFFLHECLARPLYRDVKDTLAGGGRLMRYSYLGTKDLAKGLIKGEKSLKDLLQIKPDAIKQEMSRTISAKELQKMSPEIVQDNLKKAQDLIEKADPKLLQKFSKLKDAEKQMIANSDGLMNIIKKANTGDIDNIIARAGQTAKLGKVLTASFIGLDVAFIAYSYYDIAKKTELLKYVDSEHEEAFLKAQIWNDEVSAYSNTALSIYMLAKGASGFKFGGPASILLGNAKYVGDALNEVAYSWSEGTSDFLKKSNVELYDRWYQAAGLSSKEMFARPLGFDMMGISKEDILKGKEITRESVVRALLWKSVPTDKKHPLYEYSNREAHYRLQYIRNQADGFGIANPKAGRETIERSKWYSEMMLKRDKYREALVALLEIKKIKLPANRMSLKLESLRPLSVEQKLHYDSCVHFLRNKILSAEEYSYLEKIQDKLPANETKLKVANGSALMTLGLKFRQAQGRTATKRLENYNPALLEHLDNTPILIIKHKLHNINTLLHKKKKSLSQNATRKLLEIRAVLLQYFTHTYDTDFEREEVDYEYNYENMDESAGQIVNWFEDRKKGKKILYGEYKELDVLPHEVEVYSLYYLATEMFGYTGKPSLEELKKYFHPNLANYHGIYYQEGKGWYVQLEGMDWDEFISEDLKKSSIGKMVEALRENANNIFAQRGDSALRFRANVKDKVFKNYAEVIAHYLEMGFGYHKEKSAMYVLK